MNFYTKLGWSEDRFSCTSQRPIAREAPGQTVLAVPGVNSLTQLTPVLNFLREQGTRSIMTAFDMDYMTNPHVQNGYYELAKLLSETGFQYGTYLWDPAYKGLDDDVWQCCYQQKNR